MRKLLTFCISIAVCVCIFFTGCNSNGVMNNDITTKNDDITNIPRFPNNENRIEPNPLQPVQPDRPFVDISGFDRNYSDIKKVQDGWICVGYVVIDNNNFGIIAKYDNEGNRLWEDYFGGSSGWDAFDIVQELPDNEGYIVTGQFQSVDGDLGNFNWDYGRIRSAWIKYNINGNREWLRDALFYSPLLIEENGIIAAFGSKTDSENDVPWNDLNIVKFDFDGNVTKNNSINDDLILAERDMAGFTTMMTFNSIVKTPDGYILIGHVYHSFNCGSEPCAALAGKYGPNVQAFIDKDFNFIKQEYSHVGNVDKYIPLDDGFIMIGSFELSWKNNVAKFDYDMNELWSLELEYPHNEYPDNPHNANLVFTDMIRIDSKLYIAGYANSNQCNPFRIITDMDGNLIYESGILPGKMTVHIYSDIYPYEEGYLIRARFHNYDGNDWKDEWLYYDIE